MQSVKSSLLNKYSNLLHAFSTKAIGHSQKPFSHKNLAYHVNDNAQDVLKNHLDYAKHLRYNYQNLVYMEQVHGDKIQLITQESDLNQIPTCDALITQEKDIPLMVMVADCVPILIYDPIQEAIAVVHAGRAGTFKQILKKTIKYIEARFDSHVKDLICVLGPSIHKCCYEVGEEIKDEAFVLSYDFAITQKNGSYYLDIIAILKHQLNEIGVPEEHIEVSPYCTSCNKELFFSYRAEKNTTGRFSGLLMLR